jgi:hypothetical protein
MLRRDWIVAGSIVTAAYAISIGMVFLPVFPYSVRDNILLVLALPSMLFFFSGLLKGNTFLGENPTVLVALALNLLFYTAILRWVLARLRRRKSSKRPAPRAT